MKRLEFGFFLFFVTLVVGAWASGYFSEQRVIVETTKVSLSVENVVNVQTTAKEQNTPEFTNVSIPNEYENGDFHSFVPVLKGEASLGQCEVSAESKRPWLGLYKRGAKYSLEAANVRFGNRQTDDFGVWIPMRFRDSRNALFLFGHDDSIQPGPVTTLYEMPYGGDDESLIGDEFRKDFSIGDRIYTLRVAKGAS